MTRDQAVQDVKTVLQTPVAFGAAPPDVSGLDLGGILDLLKNMDFDKIFDLLKMVAIFVPALAPVIPVIERLLPILKQILEIFGESETRSIVAEVTA